MTEMGTRLHHSAILQERLFWQRLGGIHSKQKEDGLLKEKEVLIALSLGGACWLGGTF